MNKKNLSIMDRRNEVRQFLYACYIAKILETFGFQHDESFRTTGCQIRHIHPDTGWSVIVYSDHAGMQLRDGRGDTTTPVDADFAVTLANDGIFECVGGHMVADYESPLEEIFQVLLHYLTDEDIIRCLRDAISCEECLADCEMGRVLADCSDPAEN